MGLLVNGEWRDQWYDTDSHGGEFVREGAQFHHAIERDGEFPPESGRYHLYVSLACPWAHRTLIFRKLKGLEEHIGVSVVSPLMRGDGWTYEQSEGSSGDAVNGFRYHRELYTTDTADYSGRVTVPLLWDCRQRRIVNNESAEIIRILNSAFDELTGNTLDFYPALLRTEIDAVNEQVYQNVNNGVYRAGFATSQSAYEQAYQRLFGTLDELNARLATQRYLLGAQLTEADWRLFTTLVRFDAVYYGHFKCNRQRIEDYPYLSHYLRDLYQWPGVAATVDFDHIKRHYYASHRQINPTGIVPLGPELDYTRPHNRAQLGS